MSCLAQRHQFRKLRARMGRKSLQREIPVTQQDCGGEKLPAESATVKRPAPIVSARKQDLHEMLGDYLMKAPHRILRPLRSLPGASLRVVRKLGDRNTSGHFGSRYLRINPAARRASSMIFLTPWVSVLSACKAAEEVEMSCSALTLPSAQSASEAGTCGAPRPLDCFPEYRLPTPAPSVIPQN